MLGLRARPDDVDPVQLRVSCWKSHDSDAQFSVSAGGGELGSLTLNAPTGRELDARPPETDCWSEAWQDL